MRSWIVPVIVAAAFIVSMKSSVSFRPDFVTVPKSTPPTRHGALEEAHYRPRPRDPPAVAKAA
jgi:hypothetical protein